jgi:hypothetical protein
MKTVIEMAREAGLGEMGRRTGFVFFQPGTDGLERFAELVRADEREAAQAEHEAEHEADKVIIEYHEATIKRLEAELKARRQHMNITTTYDEAMVKAMIAIAVAKEREACAQICEQYADVDTYENGVTLDFHAKLIRERSKT